MDDITPIPKTNESVISILLPMHFNFIFIEYLRKTSIASPSIAHLPTENNSRLNIFTICKLKVRRFGDILNQYIYAYLFGLPHKSERIGGHADI